MFTYTTSIDFPTDSNGRRAMRDFADIARLGRADIRRKAATTGSVQLIAHLPSASTLGEANDRLVDYIGTAQAVAAEHGCRGDRLVIRSKLIR